MAKYIVNEAHGVFLGGKQMLDNSEIIEAIAFANGALRSLDAEAKKFDINIFEALGPRNLSGLVGEYFASSVQRYSRGQFASNLHQDGYPDLLLIDSPEKKAYFETLYTEKRGRLYPKSKEAFSPYKYGGIEVKATCGNTPPADKVPKPLIGEQRISLVISFDWKAHHRETTHLLAILWDFVDEVPTIAACFYRNDLGVEDWGAIVHPKEGGGRTTSVSTMKSGGVRKMCQGWIAVMDDEQYKEKLSRKKWVGYQL